MDHPEIGVGMVMVRGKILIFFEFVMLSPGEIVLSQNFCPVLTIQRPLKSDSIEVFWLDAIFLIGHH